MEVNSLRRALTGLAVVGSVFPVRAQSVATPADWSKVVEAARKEGEVIVWGQAGEARRKFWKDAFEKAYPGITVKLFQPNTSSERDTRYLRELEAKVAKLDVFVSGSGGMSARLKPAGALQPLRPLLRPETLDGKNWVDGEPLWQDAVEKQFIITSDQSVGIAAVTNMSVPEGALKSWNDLLDPKWDKKIGTIDPQASGMAFSQALFQFLHPTMGPEYIKKLYASGRVVIVPEERQLLEWVESGRLQIGMAVREPEVTALQKVGGKLRVITSLEAGGSQVGVMAGSEGSVGVPAIPLPNPNAARVYVNWMLSKEGQQALVDTLGLASTHTLVDQSKISPAIRRVAGVKYFTTNDDRVASPQNTRNMRTLVATAIGTTK